MKEQNVIRPEIEQFEFIPVDNIDGIEKENLLKIKKQYFQIKKVDLKSQVMNALNTINEYIRFSALDD
jgi:hypothetical protein